MIDPICIGGVGGSGTRLFAQIIRKLSIYIGNYLNDTYDNLWFTLLFKRKETLKLSKNKFNEIFDIFEKTMIGNSPLTQNERELLDKIYKQQTSQDYI